MEKTLIINVEVNTEELDAAIEKANRLAELLKGISNSIGLLSECNN